MKNNISGDLHDLQESITELWCDILQRQSITPSDDFFDLGGNSLTALIMLMELKEACGITVTIRSFFDDPTIRGLISSGRTMYQADYPTTTLSGNEPSRGD